MTPIRTILHPTDFSAPAEQAFQLACSLARDRDARLILLHVLERPLIIQGGVMAAPPLAGPSEEERAALRQKLGQLQASDPKVRMEHQLEEGDAATAILQVAQETTCDLIVMGTHGRTGLARLLMGSVAEKVLRNAPCPVLTVKTPASAKVAAL